MGLVELISLFSLASPAQAAGGPVTSFPNAAALGGTEAFYCVQAGLSSQCSTNQIATFAHIGYASLSAPNTWASTQTFPANSLTLSELPQIAAQAVLGNATASTANVTAPWTVSNATDTVIPLTHGAITAAGDVACYNDTAGTIKDCEGTASVSAANSSGATPATNTVTNVTSVSLSTGTWLCNGSLGFVPTGTTTFQIGGINTTSVTLPAFYYELYNAGSVSLAGAVPPQLITGPATAYLTAKAVFSTGFVTITGSIICTLVR